MGFYPQAPLSIGKVLDSGFTMYRSVLKRLLPLSLLIGVLSQLPQLAPYAMVSAAGEGGLSGSTMLTVGVGFFIWFCAYLAFYNGWIVSMDSLGRGGEALSVGQAFSAGLPKLVSVIAAFVLFMLAIMAGTVLLVIPGIILMGSLFFFWYFIVLENQGAVASLKNSHKLVWGNWWRAMTVVTVGGVIYLVAFFVVGMIGAVVLGISASGKTPEELAAGPGAGFFIFLGLNVVVNALLLPMWNSITLVLFRDLQLRKSGADLAARAAAA